MAVAIFASTPGMAAESSVLQRPGSDAENENDDREFGRSIALDGDMLAVTSAEPAVYLFDRDGESFRHVTTLAPSDYDVEEFGSATSMDDGLIAVADRLAVVDGLTRAGVVHVFERDESGGGWQHSATLRAPLPVESGHFGTRVSVSGTRVLVSEHRSHGRPSQVHLYEPDENGEWSLARSFMGEDGSGLDMRGGAIDGDRIALTANGNGHIYEYGPSGWLLTDTIELDHALVAALEGDVLVLGAPGEDIGDRPRVEGVAYILERTAGEWMQTARIHAPNDGTAYAAFGVTVDLEDGLLAAGENHETGGLYAFMKNEAGEWTRFAQHRTGRLHYAYHDPAISAYALAIGYSGSIPGHVLWYDMPTLMTEAGLADDEDSDDGSGDDDTNNDDDSDDSGANEGDDDTNSGSEGNDPEVAGPDDDADDGAGEASGDETSGGDDAGGDTQPTDKADSGSGGGALAWLLPFVMPLLIARRRSRRSATEQA